MLKPSRNMMGHSDLDCSVARSMRTSSRSLLSLLGVVASIACSASAPVPISAPDSPPPPAPRGSVGLTAVETLAYHRCQRGQQYPDYCARTRILPELVRFINVEPTCHAKLQQGSVWNPTAVAVRCDLDRGGLDGCEHIYRAQIWLEELKNSSVHYDLFGIGHVRRECPGSKVFSADSEQGVAVRYPSTALLDKVNACAQPVDAPLPPYVDCEGSTIQ